jgi:uncharacterized membrane protein
MGEKKGGHKSMQNFAIASISVGVLLILACVVSAITILVALGSGSILIHTLSDIRSNVVRIVFGVLIPLAGGIVLIMAGFRILKLDREHDKNEIISSSMKSAVQQKEKILDVFLSKDEKTIMELLKKEPDGGALQSDLVIKTGYSKVKMHRILKSLEFKGLVKRGRFGITNKVLISK